MKNKNKLNKLKNLVTGGCKIPPVTFIIDKNKNKTFSKFDKDLLDISVKIRGI